VISIRLPAQLAVGTNLARDACHLGSEDTELLNHRVDQVCRAEELALKRSTVHVQTHNLGQISLRHRSDCTGHLVGWSQ
jgi:hypothetical protein